jgi:hypothetical protein
MLIPLTYLTRMADLIDATFDTTMLRWLPYANGSQRRLDALISGLDAWAEPVGALPESGAPGCHRQHTGP